MAIEFAVHTSPVQKAGSPAVCGKKREWEYGRVCPPCKEFFQESWQAGGTHLFRGIAERGVRKRNFRTKARRRNSSASARATDSRRLGVRRESTLLADRSRRSPSIDLIKA